MTKSPKLKPVNNREQWHSGLEAFRLRHKLSIRSLAGASSLASHIVSKSTMDRLCRGTCEPRFIEKVRPAILQSLRIYLQGLKKTPAEIDLELRTIFCQQEVESVITQRAELPLEAQQFLGLNRDPFTGDPRRMEDMFSTPALDKIARQAEEVIRYQGFSAFIGDIGTGKSLMRKRINTTVDRSKGKLVLLWPFFYNMDKVHSGSIVNTFLRHFDQPCPQDLVSRAVALRNLLGKLLDDGIKVALGFDECHQLDKRLIVALKNFWELGSGGFDRYLGVILFGQNSFEFILREHREIHERCQIVKMPTLTKHGADYLAHRIQIAGSKLDKLFEPAAVSRILKLANTPQGLGNVANAALLEAFKLQSPRVVADLVPEKAIDSQVRGIRKTS